MKARWWGVEMAFHLEGRIEELARRAGLADVPKAAVGAVATLALVAVAFAAWRFWPTSAQPGLAVATSASEEVVPVAGSGQPTASVPASATAVVHVVGAVRSPGVYELVEGARVADAIAQAGGLLPDAVAQAINLARPVADGEQILVPDEDAVEAGAVPAAATGAGGPVVPGGAAATGKIDINTADAASLDTLPGVGPSTATKIISEREANGPFATVDDLGRVSGIGPKRLEQLRDLVSAGP